MELADAHISAQARLRELAALGVRRAWARLPGYNEADVATFLGLAVPVVVAAQRASITLTDAFLALALGRAPVGIDAGRLLADRVRGGVTPEEVYRRPFVTIWTALAAGTGYDDAVAAGLARAASSAEMDVQLASRAAMAAAQDADPQIRGYQRVADDDACAYCRMIDGAFVKRADAMALHNHCGCTLMPLTRPVDSTAIPDGVAVHPHGELGPLLADPSDKFTKL